MGDVLAQRAASELKGRLRADLVDHLLALGPAFTQGERSGDLVNVAVQGVEDLDEYVTAFLPLRALAVLVPVLAALVVFAIDPLTVVVLVVTGPMLVLFLALIGSRTRELTERRFRELSWMSASFLDMLQGWPRSKCSGVAVSRWRISARWAATMATPRWRCCGPRSRLRWCWS
jgi:ATP-binding cassette subfamily C protein CydD